MNLNKFLQNLNEIELYPDEDGFYTIPGTSKYFFIFENSKIKLDLYEISLNLSKSKNAYYLKQYDFKKGLDNIKNIIRKTLDP